MTQEEICKQKIKYKTRRKAWRRSAKLFYLHGFYGSPYKCRICQKMHLTEKYALPPAKEFVVVFNKWFGAPIL